MAGIPAKQVHAQLKGLPAMSIAKIRAWFRDLWRQVIAENCERVEPVTVAPAPPSRLVSVAPPNRGRHWHEDVNHTTEFPAVAVEADR